MDYTYNNIYRLYQECLEIQSEIKICVEETYTQSKDQNIDEKIKINLKKLIQKLHILQKSSGCC